MTPARIIVLVVALAAGGIAAILAGRSDRPVETPAAPVPQLETVDVLVANADIGPGHRIGEPDLRWQVWPAAAANSAGYIRKSDRPDAVKDLAGAITRSTFSAGEPIREARLVRSNGSGYMAAILPEGMRAVSTAITTETTAGGFILPNDHVDVILTRRDRDAEKNGGGEAQVSEVILSNIRVLAIDQIVEEKDGMRATTNSRTATLELTARQATEMMRAAEMGKLSLALRSIVDFGKTKPVAEEPDGRRQRVDVVRFGIKTVGAAK
jgi:pilus assembly protein CpaB